MRTNRSIIWKLDELGLWNGPNRYLVREIKYAYQMVNNRAFMGVFKKGALDGVLDMLSGRTNIYLGKPSKLFEPMIGRDKIRTSDGILKIIEDTTELNISFNEVFFDRKKGGVLAGVLASDKVLVAYPLVHDRQNDIFLPASFEKRDIRVYGLRDIGAEILRQLIKLGLNNVVVYDDEEVGQADLCMGPFRIYDAFRGRSAVMREICGDQGMVKIEARQAIGAEDIGEICIVSLSGIARKNLWELIKSCKLLIDVQHTGTKGKIFVIDPSDTESVSLYENDLGIDSGGSCSISIVSMLASLVTMILQRYLNTPGNEKGVLGRLYTVDTELLYGKSNIEIFQKY